MQLLQQLNTLDNQMMYSEVISLETFFLVICKNDKTHKTKENQNLKNITKNPFIVHPKRQLKRKINITSLRCGDHNLMQMVIKNLKLLKSGTL
ncbi:CLUMA_CG014580, isoform A [Clunio marinus]|uniref:CLUMA_CG014580, isoform A n=1 Tax=Clunio marinus TaxID=568069 RepID=A0A1J1INQ8_9DIPT|nr:CLUMA_CG014580, isoform A [Clunio marinus]